MLDNAWYIDDGNNSSTGWWALTQWSNNAGAGTVYAAATIIRQSGTPTVGNERVYICVVAGTGGTGADPLTTFTRGVVITSGTATFQECTGVAALNGDLTNTPTWAQMRASSTTASLGQVIQRNNGASYQICTVSGTVGGSEPAFSNTAGTATTDNAATWRSLGVVGNFTTIFAAPHARMASAYAANWGAAGNSFFIKSTSAETQTTAMTLTSPGTLANPTYTYSVGTGATPPTSVTAGATISTTGASALTFGTGAAYWYGITFQAGSVASSASINLANANTTQMKWDTCGFTLANTNTNSRINWMGVSGGSAVRLTFINPTFTFGAQANQGFATQAGEGTQVSIQGGSVVVGATVPSTLFISSPAVLTWVGGDLSALGSGKTLMGASALGGVVTLQDCKYGASVTVAATPTILNSQLLSIRSDSGATNYRLEKYSYLGTQTTETTIVRTGGATSGTAISWKVAPTANAKWILPFECIPIVVYNPNVAQNVTATVHGIWSGGAVPTNADCWMALEYLGTSSFPLGVINSGTKASNLASNTPQSADTTSVWGAGSTTAFQMSTTLSSPQPTFAGYFHVWIYVGAASGTFYFDPLAVLS